MTQTATTAKPIVELTDVRHVIGNKEILHLPSWQVAASAHSLILGPSGSGKTTLLHLLAGLAAPTTGQINIAGQALAALPAAQLDRFRGRHIGIVPQRLHLVPALTVDENLYLARYLAGLTQDDELIKQTLERLEIADKNRRRPAHLSQGEAQRVAIARAVINQPKLILADEPTSALDDKSCQQVIELLLQQAQSCGATLLIATHDGRVKERFDQHHYLELAHS